MKEKGSRKIEVSGSVTRPKTCAFEAEEWWIGGKGREPICLYFLHSFPPFLVSFIVMNHLTSKKTSSYPTKESGPQAPKSVVRGHCEVTVDGNKRHSLCRAGETLSCPTNQTAVLNQSQPISTNSVLVENWAPLLSHNLTWIDLLFLLSKYIALRDAPSTFSVGGGRNERTRT